MSVLIYVHMSLQYGYIVIFVEWLTFACTHCRGAKWRIPEDTFPWLVTRVMANGGYSTDLITDLVVGIAPYMLRPV